MNVIARTSVLRYADGKTPIPDIARELNVQTVMEGSAALRRRQRANARAQLIDAKSGAHLWSEAYSRKIERHLRDQADIAMNIANAVRAEFSLEEQKAIEKPLTTSPEAYALTYRRCPSTSRMAPLRTREFMVCSTAPSRSTRTSPRP
jgi:hypothetical protein